LGQLVIRHRSGQPVFTCARIGCKIKTEAVMDATLERIDRLIMMALEHLDQMRGTEYERYAENVLESLVCQREKYTYYLSLLN
jgi:hypothetical protein